MGPPPEHGEARAFERADNERRLVAGHAGGREPRKVGVGNGGTVNGACQVAKAGAEHEGDWHGGGAGAGADDLDGLHQRSLT